MQGLYWSKNFYKPNMPSFSNPSRKAETLIANKSFTVAKPTAGSEENV
jgi:hypothetical protein